MDEEILTLEAGNTHAPDYRDMDTSETDNKGIRLEDAMQADRQIQDKGSDISIKETTETGNNLKKGTVDGDINPETVKSLMVLNEKPLIRNPGKDNEIAAANAGRAIIPESKSQKTSPESSDEVNVSLNDKDLELLSSLESRISGFEEKMKAFQSKMDESFNSNTELLSSFGNELQTRADSSELQKLKQDFDHFSRKLRRVVQAEDSVSSESLDATKVPPDVLEITYAKTLNDLFSAMLKIYGDAEASDMVEDARENVRQFSAGVDFFRFEEGAFIVRGLSEAITSKIISVKQIHGTYIELFKMLFQYVPNYNSQDFRAFVETGSREYTIEKVVSHEESLGAINADIDEFKKEIANITENVTFIAELQNNQIEEVEAKTQELSDIRGQMKSIAKAVNLHTRALKKLNKTLMEFRENQVLITPGSPSESTVETKAETLNLADFDKLEEMVGSKAGKDEIMLISGEFEAFKLSVEGMFASLQQQLEEGLLNSRKLKEIEDGLIGVHEELNNLQFAEESKTTDEQQSDIEPQPVIEPQGFDESRPVVETESFSAPQAPDEKKQTRITDLPIEEVIITQLAVLGSATLKQLEKQINEQGYPIDFEKLSLVMAYLEQEQLVETGKKGRYTFYSIASPANA